MNGSIRIDIRRQLQTNGCAVKVRGEEGCREIGGMEQKKEGEGRRKGMLEIDVAGGAVLGGETSGI